VRTIVRRYMIKHCQKASAVVNPALAADKGPMREDKMYRFTDMMIPLSTCVRNIKKHRL